MEKGIEGETSIRNDLGLHTRAATSLVKLANTFSSEIEIFANGISANAKSIMGLLALGARKGTSIRIKVKGSDQGVAFSAIVQLVEQGFKEGE